MTGHFEYVILRHPESRDVYVNGLKMGKTNQVLRVNPGMHAFSLGRSEEVEIMVADTTVIEPMEICLDPAPTVEGVVAMLGRLSDAQRVEVFHKFCKDCGTAHLPCSCLSDLLESIFNNVVPANGESDEAKA